MLGFFLFHGFLRKKKKELLNVFENQEKVKQQTELNGLNVFCIDAVAVQTFNPNHWNNQTLKLEELADCTVLHNAKIAQPRLMKRRGRLDRRTSKQRNVCMW